MASGDDTARAVTTTLTTSEPEVDRSVHPSGIVPTLQCVLFHTISLIIVYDEKRKRELSLGKTPRDRRV